jgi:hypothetical protein
MPPQRKVLPQITQAIEQVRKDLMVAMGELAYAVKADFLRDREELRKQHNEIVALLARFDDLEERHNILNDTVFKLADRLEQ